MVRYLKNKRGPADELVIAVVRKGTEDAMERRLPSLKPWTEFFNSKQVPQPSSVLAFPRGRC